jgi:hypothetical protein
MSPWPRRPRAPSRLGGGDAGAQPSLAIGRHTRRVASLASDDPELVGMEAPAKAQSPPHRAARCYGVPSDPDTCFPTTLESCRPGSELLSTSFPQNLKGTIKCRPTRTSTTATAKGPSSNAASSRRQAVTPGPRVGPRLLALMLLPRWRELVASEGGGSRAWVASASGASRDRVARL